MGLEPATEIIDENCAT